MKNILVYGVGSNCGNFLYDAISKDFNVLAIIDKNKYEMEFEGIKIESPIINNKLWKNPRLYCL